MAKNKVQHFVPKFYLKSFSNKGEGKQIGVFLPDQGKFFTNGSVKDEGAAKYFYGSDLSREADFQKIENHAAKLFTSILTDKRIPSFGTLERDLLLFFIVLQDNRTQLRLSSSNESLNFLKKELTPELIKKIDDENVSLMDMFFDFSIEYFSILGDLTIKLLINNTNAPFVTSDHPIVKYNQMAEKFKFLSCSTGYSSSGLQIFLPLSPKIAIALYDTKAYKYANKKNWIILIDQATDVHSLNILQCIYCNEKIYFNSEETENYIDSLVSSVAGLPRINTESKGFFDLVRDGEVYKEGVFVNSLPEAKINLSLSFIKIIGKSLDYNRNQSNIRKTAKIPDLPPMRLSGSTNK